MFRSLLLALLVISAAPAAACRLALVLAIDISNSVDGSEFRLQVDGLAEALLDPVVREDLVRGRSALAVMLWSGPASQYVVAPWRRMESDADVAELSRRIAALRRTYPQSNTAIGSALARARELFSEVPDCASRTIDVSGDGRDNAGSAPGLERAAAAAEGVTVNALVIESPYHPLADYFLTEVVTPDGFAMVSRGHAAYAETLRRKLRREVGEAMM